MEKIIDTILTSITSLAKSIELLHKNQKEILKRLEKLEASNESK